MTQNDIIILQTQGSHQHVLKACTDDITLLKQTSSDAM